MLVHSAGAIALGPFESVAVAPSSIAMYRVNPARPGRRCTQALLPALKRARARSSSSTRAPALRASADNALYAATKHGLKAIADGLRDEVNPGRVRVLSVYTGRTARRCRSPVHEHRGARHIRPELLTAPGGCRRRRRSHASAVPPSGEVTDSTCGRSRKLAARRVRVLVTGHHGYIGSVLAPVLRDAGHDVVGLDTFYYRGCDFGDGASSSPSLALDVRDVRPADLEGFDAVVHLAALSNDPLGDLNPDWTYAINRDGTVALARAAKEAGVRRFVFASSCSMYGAAEGDDALDEAAPLRPLTPYAESKVAAEEALARARRRRLLAGLDAQRDRLRRLAAPAPRHRPEQPRRLGAHDRARSGSRATARSWRPLVHVRDVRAATLALLEAPDDARPRRGVQHRLRGAELPHPRARGDRPRPAAGLRGHVRGGCLARSAELPRRLLEVRVGVPGVPLRVDGRARRGRARAGVRGSGLTFEDFQGHRYIRLGQLKRLLEAERSTRASLGAAA